VKPSSLERRLLAFIADEPQTATVIWRRFYGLPDGNLSLTTRMRRERRTTAAMLEGLAADGHIVRTEIERRGMMLPAYSRH
jgi:hypothetical protein